MVSFEKLDAQKFYNCQFLAPSYYIVAKTLPWCVWWFSAIILMEGGTEEDLKCLEEVEEDKVEEGSRSRSTSESRPQEQR